VTQYCIVGLFASHMPPQNIPILPLCGPRGRGPSGKCHRAPPMSSMEFAAYLHGHVASRHSAQQSPVVTTQPSSCPCRAMTSHQASMCVPTHQAQHASAQALTATVSTALANHITLHSTSEQWCHACDKQLRAPSAPTPTTTHCHKQKQPICTKLATPGQHLNLSTTSSRHSTYTYNPPTATNTVANRVR
jgi:hypothetical protein